MDVHVATTKVLPSFRSFLQENQDALGVHAYSFSREEISFYLIENQNIQFSVSGAQGANLMLIGVAVPPEKIPEWAQHLIDQWQKVLEAWNGNEKLEVRYVYKA
ncbi:hypothetical protein C5B42_03405 [Candidatus Cerribacteria bacterium 'Amazon FNV 2010 28 9']|uniref:Uncharacterized protein n=1 Tax=Candidatus Cerribacteria bacterium 'Amazon FNV 2010 28 9' TaxID=2081795 RepID=A0A317JNF0_9BACT|nr:MAG: hypothetical protein C5B42_03405 [Candidatus Cerribacteria bacterium 'Amazon FNV 2010 28 9']